MSGLGDWIAPTRTALLIIDMQADFADPAGALGRAGLDLATVPAALAKAEALAAAARAAGTGVVFIGLHTTAATDSPVWIERARRGGETDTPLCRAGSPGAAFRGPRPASGETVIFKARYSAFFGTALDAILQARAIDTLVLCGLTTECCIAATAFDAAHLDYHTLVIADATAAYEPALHAATLRSLQLNGALVVDANQVLAAWTPAHPNLEEGRDEVRGRALKDPSPRPRHAPP